MLLLVIIVTTVQFWQLMLSPSLSPHTSLQSVKRGTDSDNLENPICGRTAGQVRVLLLLSGDIEMNPGPCTGTDIPDPLIGGLADLVGEAPGNIRDILCVWSPEKPDNEIAAELNSRKFTVSMLQPALAWLLNKEISDPLVQTVKKKSDIVQAVILGIERLLPDTWWCVF